MLKSGIYIIMSKVGPAGSTGKEMSLRCGTCIFTPKLIPWAVQPKIISTRMVELYTYLECIL